MEHPHTPLSSSAKAEDPVRRGLSVLSSASLEYWIVRPSAQSRTRRTMTVREPLSNVTFSQWVDGGAGFSSFIQVPAELRPSAVRLSAPYSSCGRECPAGKE